MDRISSANAFDGAIANLLSRQEDLSATQIQLTSGKRVVHASDDPTAAARAERARALIARTDASKRAVDASRNAMTLTESALGDATNLLQSARELVVAAGNASYSDAERAAVAKQIQSVRDQLLSVANRPDGAGGYVFSGQGSGAAPFADSPGTAATLTAPATLPTVKFTGVGGSVHVASDEPLPLTLDGGSIWLHGNTGNGVFETKNMNSGSAWIDAGHVVQPSQLTNSTYSVQFNVSAGSTTYAILKDGNPTPVTAAAYTSGQSITVDGLSFAISGAPASGDKFQIAPSQPDLSVFAALDTITKALLTKNQSGPQVTQAVQTGLRDIDQAASQLQSARSDAGQTLSRLDGVQGRLDASALWGETTRSNAEDLDMVKALASFQNQQTGYQAALQSYASVQKMSLMQYLNV